MSYWAERMKKGRASDVTRPEPTIYGNCDSWFTIVGKNSWALMATTCIAHPLQGHNEMI